MNSTNYTEINLSNKAVEQPSNPAKLLKLVERVPHWSGLEWHKKKVRAKYKRDSAKWWKQYFSASNQKRLQEEKKNASKSTSQR